MDSYQSNDPTIEKGRSAFACFSLGFSIKGDDDAREHVIPVFWPGEF